MKEILTEFHNLLISKKGVAILKPDHRNADTIVLPKLNVDRFISAIQDVISESEDIQDPVTITAARQFDYGYLVEIDLDVLPEDGGFKYTNRYELIFATQY